MHLWSRSVKRTAPWKLPPKKISPQKIATYENCPLWKYPPMKVPPSEIYLLWKSPQEIALKKITPTKLTQENCPL